MNKTTLLREYLRTCRRVKLHPSSDGFKKIEYLRFTGADVCPSCGEDVDLDAYLCTRTSEGILLERYRCRGCGADFVFSQEAVH